MTSTKSQLDFLSKANNWLKKQDNQKKFAITEDNSNPPMKDLCIYILGGWAINRYSHYRKTKDIDLVADNVQLLEILKSFEYSGDFKPSSSPDSNTEFTQKHTLISKEKEEFSLEARFFNVDTDEINFGIFKTTRDWLYTDSDVFNERTINTLEYIRVPSLKKLIAMKLFSAVGRNVDDEEKIIADFIDIHNLQISKDSFSEIDKTEIIQLLKQLSFATYTPILKTRFEKLRSILQKKTENSIKDDSILFTIINSDELNSDTASPITVKPLKAIDIIKDEVIKNQFEKISKQNKSFVTGFGNLELKLLELFKNARHSIHLFYTDREMGFAFNYVISYVSCIIKNGIKIDVNYFQDTSDPEKAVRGINKIRNLKYLGFNVRIIPFRDKKPPFTGVIIDPKISGHSSLLSFSDYSNDIYFYTQNFDGETSIKKLFSGYESLLEKFPKEYFENFIPSFSELTESEYINILRMVPEYQNLKDGDFSFVNINSKELGNLLTHQTTGIKKFKLNQHTIFNSLEEFKPDKVYAINMQNNFKHVINIPIIEKINDKKYIIEGHTRLFTSYTLYTKTEIETEIFAVTINYTNLSIDSELSIIEHIELKDMYITTEYKTHPLTGKIYNPKKRNIESYTHGSYHYDWKRDFPLLNE